MNKRSLVSLVMVSVAVLVGVLVNIPRIDRGCETVLTYGCFAVFQRGWPFTFWTNKPDIFEESFYSTSVNFSHFVFNILIWGAIIAVVFIGSRVISRRLKDEHMKPARVVVIIAALVTSIFVYLNLHTYQSPYGCQLGTFSACDDAPFLYKTFSARGFPWRYYEVDYYQKYNIPLNIATWFIATSLVSGTTFFYLRKQSKKK